MDSQVVLSLSARADPRDIVRYISFDAPDRALQFGWFLISRTRLLGRSPELGRIVLGFGDALLREIIVSSYRVVLSSQPFTTFGRGYSVLARRARHARD
jgi:plasmid stabilization system protein ParE